jgi:hypothetical protein
MRDRDVERPELPRSHRFPNPASCISSSLISLVRRLRNVPCHAAILRVQCPKLNLFVAVVAVALG